jgi:GNAT superfamily N-acetyltransferase
MSSNLARKLGARAASHPARPVETHPAPASRAPSAARQAKVEPRGRHLVLAVAMAILVGINAIGSGYYASPPGIRVRHPLHDWLKPSGFIGQGAGLLAFTIFVFLWLYPLRKRFKSLAWTGSVGRWLDVHVTAALTLPLLLAIHAAWRFDGVIGLGYTAILLVCASGVVGRYLYTRIPRARSGVELTRDEVASQRVDLIERIAATTRIDRKVVEATLLYAAPAAGRLGVGRAMLELVAGDLIRWYRVRALRKRWVGMAPAGQRPARKSLDEAVQLASREMSLAQQVRLLDATHRVFRWWHVAHRPVALTALIAVLVHVVVVIAVGATWLG